MSNKSCPKCGGRMEQGFVAAKTSHGNVLSEWIEGVAQRSIWTGVKLRGRRRLTLETFRCGRCAYLESYAPEA